MPTTSKLPSCRSPAPPARWASRSPTSSNNRPRPEATSPGRATQKVEGAEMAQHGKKYEDASKRYDKQALHGVAEAVDPVKTLAAKKFDETVEVAIQLGVDPRKADQQLRGTVTLPAGSGKTARVAVFAAGDAAA